MQFRSMPVEVILSGERLVAYFAYVKSLYAAFVMFCNNMPVQKTHRSIWLIAYVACI
jgi:hypothetical protein